MTLYHFFSFLVFILYPTGTHADNILIRPWGKNSFRIQVAKDGVKLRDDLPSAIIGTSPSDFSSSGDPIVNGNLKAEVDPDGMLTFSRVSDGVILLRETERVTPSSTTLNFSSCATKLYGMGQERHGYSNSGLNVIGQSFNFSVGSEGGPDEQLPWIIAGNPDSGFQFGFLWNNPAMGGVKFGSSDMQWSTVKGDGKQFLREQLEFFVTTFASGSVPSQRVFDIMHSYVDAVGHIPMMPEWATGYWHSKNRYHTQTELLEVAQGFHNRSIPVDVIVIDWFHWKTMGDWSFNSRDWPDPKSMVDQLAAMGMQVMVSVWPFTCPGSRSYDNITANNWMTTYFDADGKRTRNGIETHGKNCHLVDATNPDLRKFVWSLIVSGYYQYGIKVFWLDASEPEGFGDQEKNASWSAGAMQDMGSMFVNYWAQTFHDGLRNSGEKDIIMLPRGGWVGSWRYGAALWSGDIGGTLPVMANQVPAGISAQMSGIGWWTTDIGGYSGGNSQDATYREIIVRWFQYGMTCPLFRQHGHRDHTAIWYYGDRDEKIIGDIIKLRASLKPYILQHMSLLNQEGRPFNRPLFWDFPEDPKTWEIAESGLGGFVGPHQIPDGTFAQFKVCNTSLWSQQWSMWSDKTIRPTGNFANASCIDNDGGPYHVHMWTCSQKWAAAQEWVYDTDKTLRSTKGECLVSISTDDYPRMAKCDPTDKSQQWDFTSSGGVLKNVNKNKCLATPDQTSLIDQYMMGDDFMVAPVMHLGQRARRVYFPKGSNWVHHYTKKIFTGGTIATVDVPIDQFPLFKKVS